MTAGITSYGRSQNDENVASLPAIGLSKSCALTVDRLVVLELLPALVGEKHRLAGQRAVVGCRIDPRLERFAVDHHAVGVGEVVARAGHPFAHALMRAEVIGEFPALGGLANLVVREIILGHHIIVDVQAKVARGRLAVDQPVRLDRGFLRIALALDRNAAGKTPFCRPTIGAQLPRIGIEHVVKRFLEHFVLLKLFLDLVQERLRDRLDHAEDRDRDLGVAHQLLDGAGKGDDRALVVKARPQIDVPVRVELHLTAAIEQPGVCCVPAPEQTGQQEIAIVAAEQRKFAGREFSRRLRVPRGGLLVIESE